MLFLQKNAKFSSAGGSAPRPPKQPPHCEFLATCLIDSMYENAFCSMINQPTRITDTTATVLDQIWTNTQFIETHANILVDSGSDYLPVLLCANFASKSTNQKSMIRKRSFSEANQLLFQNRLSGLDISLLPQIKDVNKAFTMLMTEFTTIFNECFPLLSVQIKTLNNQWYDDELKELHKIKNHCYKKYIASKTLIAKSKYNEMRNKYFHLIEKKTQNYYTQSLNNHRCSIKDTWKVINSLVGKINSLKARNNAPYFPLPRPNHLQLKLNTRMQDVERVLDLNPK